MRKILLTILITMCFAGVKAQTEKVKVPEGTVISLRLLEELSTKKNNAGDIVSLDVLEPVIIGSRVVIPAGCKAYGKVTSAAKAKIVYQSSSMGFSIDYLNMPDGTILKINSEQRLDGKAFNIITWSRNVTYKKGKIFKVFLAQDYEL